MSVSDQNSKTYLQTKAAQTTLHFVRNTPTWLKKKREQFPSPFNASLTLGARGISCAVSGFNARVKDNKARPRSFFFFFAARVFGRTTREKPLVPRVRLPLPRLYSVYPSYATNREKCVATLRSFAGYKKSILSTTILL